MHTKYLFSFLSPILPSLVAIGVLGAATRASLQGEASFETETITARDGARLTAELGRLSVPENRSREDSREISLAFMRVRHPGEDPGPPVFFLAGGPGGSSIDAVRSMVQGGGQRFFDLIGGDIVGIDQRGVGQSEPNLSSTTLFDFPPEEPGDPDRDLARVRSVCSEEAARWREQGVDLDGYNSAESADDIDAVRRALGYEKISLWGASYGSHLAMATLRRHEEHIARALLVGPEGPDHTVKLPSYSQGVLERIGELVAADAALSEAIPDFVGLLRTVLERLEREPVVVEVDGQRVGVSKYDVQQLVAQEIGSDAVRIGAVPRMLFEMERGDFDEPARKVLENRRTAGVWTAMGMAMDAASGLTAERAERIAREAEACLLEDAVTYGFTGTAEAWGVRDLGDAFRGTLQVDVPVLFVVGDLDARTPISNARELMEHMPNAHLIVVENAGHATPMGVPELRDAWGTFLRGGEVSLERVDAGAVRFALPDGLEAEPPEGAVEVAPEELAKCSGSYRFPNGMTFVIEPAEGRLVATIPGRGDFDLWPRSARDYFCEDPNIPPLTFVSDDTGKITAVEGGGIRGERQ